ncbi:MAG: DUF4164 family protein [Proteobacteria bacterium]|nr:DUF4164 family protein [Pseudomonadota bacterium]
MDELSAIEAATRRLLLALDALDGAVERRREADRDIDRLAAQLHAHDLDRARLAADLDRAAARIQQLEAANREIARRLDTATESIRAIADAQEE